MIELKTWVSTPDETFKPHAEAEFWKEVFLKKIERQPVDVACRIADEAVQELRKRTGDELPEVTE